MVALGTTYLLRKATCQKSEPAHARTLAHTHHAHEHAQRQALRQATAFIHHTPPLLKLAFCLMSHSVQEKRIALLVPNACNTQQVQERQSNVRQREWRQGGVCFDRRTFKTTGVASSSTGELGLSCTGEPTVPNSEGATAEPMTSSAWAGWGAGVTGMSTVAARLSITCRDIDARLIALCIKTSESHMEVQK